MKFFERNEENVKSDGKKSGRFYTFKEGKTTLRILPPYSERGVWFRPRLEYYLRFGSDLTVLCSPRSNGGDDPIADYVNAAYRSGDEAEVNAIQDLRPRKKFLVNALILSEPGSNEDPITRGIQIVSIPTRVKEALVTFDTDPDAGYGDITNLEKGHNVIIERRGTDIRTTYNVVCAGKSTNILETAKEKGIDPETWEPFNLDDEVKPASQEELENALKRFLSMDQPAEPMSDKPEEKTEVTVQTESEVPDLPEPPEENKGGE